MDDLEAILDEHDVPGAAIATFRDGVIELRLFGVESRSTNEPVRQETRFQAASISKLVTAVAVLGLADDLGIDLDAPVNETLRSWKIPDSGFTHSRPVTLHHLLSHTGGTTVSGFRGYAEGEEIPTLAQVLDGLPPANSDAIRVDKAPGEGYRYSGGGYCILERWAADNAGLPFSAFLHMQVLGPVGMRHSSFEFRPYDATEPPVASGHGPDGDEVPGRYHTYPERAAAGLWTTATDLARLAMAVQGALAGGSDRLLRQEVAQRMVTPVTDDSGLGIEPVEIGGEPYFVHSGRNEGFECYLIAHHTEGVGGVVMINSAMTPALMELVRRLGRRERWPGYPADEGHPTEE